MLRVLQTGTGSLFILVIWLLLWPGAALASSNPARTETVAAGSYIIDVNLSQDPPYTEQPFDVTIVPHDSNLHLTGKLVAQPGLGTDATNMPTTLSTTGNSMGSLKGSLRIPVQGAWHIQILLDGPRGHGEANVSVTVGAPGALPSWLAWLIGSSPLVGVAIWLWFQHRYRQTLLAQHSM